MPAAEHRPIGKRHRQSGVTMVEALVVVAIMGVLAALTLPTLAGITARGHLRSAAEQLRSDINLARGEAVKRNASVRMSFVVDGGTWCYGLRTAADCDCTVTDPADAEFCFLDTDAGGVAIRYVTDSTRFRGVTLAGNPFSGGLTFSPVRPALISGSATYSSTNVGGSLRVVASGMGRVRLCAPGGLMSGYVSC